MRQGFTTIELLVVISIITLLFGVLVPSLSRIKEQATVTVVDSELRQIGLALEMYYENNRKYPPTQANCSSGSISKHLYQTPDALVKGNYLPAALKTEAMSTTIEDRFNRGHTYKYRSVGEIIKDRDRIDKYISARLWIPDGFPSRSSIEPNDACWRPNNQEVMQFMNDKSLMAANLPVSWVIFSLGPKFSEEWLYEKVGFDNRYPVPKELWYTPKERRGFIVRMRLQNGMQIGSFEKDF